MKFLFVLFTLIAAAFAAPQFFPGGGFSGSNAAAQAGSFSGGGFPGGFSGSNAAAQAGSFSGGGGGGFSGANAAAQAGSFGFGK